jgi:hypothetical protein
MNKKIRTNLDRFGFSVRKGMDANPNPDSPSMVGMVSSSLEE